MATYKIIRMYRDGRPSETIDTGLTLEEAREHCRRKDTHEKDENGIAIWFDGYEEE